MIRRTARCLLVVSCLALPLGAAIAPAWAEGGTSIASAPSVAYGQQEFGNLNNGGTNQDGCGTGYDEWWLLPVAAGDKVTVDWQIDADFSSNNFYDSRVDIFPIGTNDFNVDSQDTVVQSSPNDTGKNEFSLVATQTGNMVLDVDTDGCGSGQPFPYDFTASVKHGVALGLPHIKKVSPGKVVRVGVHRPGGVAIVGSQPTVRLELEVDGRWKVIGSAQTDNGVATITAEPKHSQIGSDVPLRAQSLAGGGYVSAASNTQYVTVT